MFNVDSKAAIKKLSRKSFAAARSRNLIAVIAIALTALFSIFRESITTQAASLTAASSD